jgi:hypothetical protein
VRGEFARRSKNFGLNLVGEQQILSVSITIVNHMYVSSIPVSKQRKYAMAGRQDFIIYLSMLGGFIGLIGYVAAVCHHIH